MSEELLGIVGLDCNGREFNLIFWKDVKGVWVALFDEESLNETEISFNFLTNPEGEILFMREITQDVEDQEVIDGAQKALKQYFNTTEGCA